MRIFEERFNADMTHKERSLCERQTVQGFCHDLADTQGDGEQGGGGDHLNICQHKGNFKMIIERTDFK